MTLGVWSHYLRELARSPKFGAHIFLLVSASLASPWLFGADFAQGVTAYKRGDYAAAFEVFDLIARQGDPRGQFALGLMYDNGEAVDQDNEAAFDWYRKSAEQGFAKAQFNLALMYAEGRGIPADNEAARDWFARAAEGGNADAIDKLHAYAAEGDLAAELTLGRLYFHGRGLPRNLEEAQKRFRTCADAKDAEAMFFLARTLIQQDDSGNIPKDAFGWYQKASDAGHHGASYNLAILYRRGLAVAPNPDKALNLYQRAAKGGHVDAALSLGMLFEQGGPWPQDISRARYWYKKAAKLGSDIALNNLAAMEIESASSREEMVKVRKLLERAAESGNREAKENLRRVDEYLTVAGKS